VPRSRTGRTSRVEPITPRTRIGATLRQQEHQASIHEAIFVDLGEYCDDLVATKAHAQAVDLDDRLRASTALEREASGRSALQATSLAALETRAFNSSSPSNGIMMIASDSLCVRVFRPSHRVIRCCSRPVQHHRQLQRRTTHHHHPLIVPMTLGDGNIATIYALSHVHGAGNSPVATRGFTGNTTITPFIPSKPFDGLRAFADDVTIILGGMDSSPKCEAEGR
jgi:hypothetical protein